MEHSEKNQKYCVFFVGESVIDIGGVSREFYSGISFSIFFLVPYCQKILRLDIFSE